MKKVSAILLVVVAMFVLAGCEHDDNPSESRQDVVQTKSEPTKLRILITSISEKTVIDGKETFQRILIVIWK